MWAVSARRLVLGGWCENPSLRLQGTAGFSFDYAPAYYYARCDFFTIFSLSMARGQATLDKVTISTNLSQSKIFLGASILGFASSICLLIGCPSNKYIQSWICANTKTFPSFIFHVSRNFLCRGFTPKYSSNLNFDFNSRRDTIPLDKIITSGNPGVRGLSILFDRIPLLSN